MSLYDLDPQYADSKWLSLRLPSDSEDHRYGLHVMTDLGTEPTVTVSDKDGTVEWRPEFVVVAWRLVAVGPTRSGGAAYLHSQIRLISDDEIVPLNLTRYCDWLDDRATKTDHDDTLRVSLETVASRLRAATGTREQQ